MCVCVCVCVCACVCACVRVYNHLATEVFIVYRVSAGYGMSTVNHRVA